MNRFLVRVFLNESNWSDSVIYADSWFQAEAMGKGQSPVGRAQYLGEA
jgi:hypothetical protein